MANKHSNLRILVNHEPLNEVFRKRASEAKQRHRLLQQINIIEYYRNKLDKCMESNFELLNNQIKINLVMQLLKIKLQMHQIQSTSKKTTLKMPMQHNFTKISSLNKDIPLIIAPKILISIIDDIYTQKEVSIAKLISKVGKIYNIEAMLLNIYSNCENKIQQLVNEQSKNNACIAECQIKLEKMHNEHELIAMYSLLALSL